MGKSTISMAMFNSYVSSPEGKSQWHGSILLGCMSKFFNMSGHVSGHMITSEWELHCYVPRASRSSRPAGSQDPRPSRQSSKWSGRSKPAERCKFPTNQHQPAKAERLKGWTGTFPVWILQRLVNLLYRVEEPGRSTDNSLQFKITGFKSWSLTSW